MCTMNAQYNENTNNKENKTSLSNLARECDLFKLMNKHKLNLKNLARTASLR